MTGATYDTGALLAAEADNRRMWLLHRRTLERGIVPTVPATVLGQAWRGGPQANLSRLVAGCDVEHLSEGLARTAGALLARSGTSDLVDASVVASALARHDAVYTSDRGDLERLAHSANRDLHLIDV